MTQLALTRASTIGPIMQFVRKGGGSVGRVFKAAQLPVQLAATPDVLIPLRDQCRLVEFAARELGDDALPARISISAGATGLGFYGAQFVAASSLGAAIRRGNEIFALTLQSATRMSLAVQHREARWTYEVAESEGIGRQKNAILAIGYIVALVRRFAGTTWVPKRVGIPGATLPGRAAMESLLGCEIVRADRAAVVFATELLELPNPDPAPDAIQDVHAAIPTSKDFPGCVRELIRLGLLEARPQREWIARRLDMSVRTLQRRLREQGTSFAATARHVIMQQAVELLGSGKLSVTEIADPGPAAQL